jgi:hypothetical protein
MAGVLQVRQGRQAAGTTLLHYGDVWSAAGSEAAAVSETSLFTPFNSTTPGPIDVSAFEEAVLLVNVTAIAGTGPSFVITVYACDSFGTRYAAIVTRTITTVSSTRDIIPVPASTPGPAGPLGNYIEVTKTLSGTGPSVTATVELQLKT